MIEGIPNDKFGAAFIISIIAGIPMNWKKFLVQMWTAALEYSETCV